MRKIIHIDMDAFFASVEQRDFPEYRGRPLIVGGLPNKRGVVAACSYEARKFGIHSAMASSKAYRLCPQAIFVYPRFDAYKQASNEICEIFYHYTDLVEPLSLDEAYLDVTGSSHCGGSASLIAKEIKAKIKEKTKLTASAGVSYNKFLAKIASDVNKPDGFYLIKPEDGLAFIKKLPVKKFYGVGKVTAKKMHGLGIYTGADMQNKTLQELETLFGNSGAYYYKIANGIDDRQVISHYERKSIGAENTFDVDLDNKTEMLIALEKLAERVFGLLEKKKLNAECITLKVKYDNFQQVTRSKTGAAVSSIKFMMEVVRELLDKTEAGNRKVRLLGMSVSKLSEQGAIDSVNENSVDKKSETQLGLF